MGGNRGDVSSGLSCSTDRTAGVIGVFGSASSAGSHRELRPASLACVVGDSRIESNEGPRGIVVGVVDGGRGDAVTRGIRLRGPDRRIHNAVHVSTPSRPTCGALESGQWGLGAIGSCPMRTSSHGPPRATGRETGVIAQCHQNLRGVWSSTTMAHIQWCWWSWTTGEVQRNKRRSFGGRSCRNAFRDPIT